MANRVVHFDIMADDPERAAAFYQKAFGWTFSKWDGPMDYWLVKTGDESERGIDGGMARREKPGDQVTNTIGVDSVDEAVAAIEAAGGTVVAPKMAIPGIGYLAYFADTEGNVLGVMDNDTSAA